LPPAISPRKRPNRGCYPYSIYNHYIILTSMYFSKGTSLYQNLPKIERMIKKENYKPISLIPRDTKIPNEIFSIEFSVT
jgi:hypothetical protein